MHEGSDPSGQTGRQATRGGSTAPQRGSTGFGQLDQTAQQSASQTRGGSTALGGGSTGLRQKNLPNG